MKGPTQANVHLEGPVGSSGPVTLCWYDSNSNVGGVILFAYLRVYTNSESLLG